MKKVIIVGAGPSGLTAAIKLSKKYEVIVLERNDKIGKKLLLTGSGHCNYYNSDQDIKHYHSNNPDLIKELVNENNLNKVNTFFNKIGLVPKIKNGYYYPMSNQATSVNNALISECLNRSIKILTNEFVKSIRKNENTFEVETSNNKYTCDKLVLSTGSCAYPKTGSDGNGYDLLRSFNIPVTNIYPSLVQINCKKDKFNYKDWDKVRCDASVKLIENNIEIKKEVGQIQLTDYGLSGICIMQLSGLINKGINNNKKEQVEINFLPEINDLKQYLINRSNILKNRELEDLLDGLLNYKLVNLILKTLKISHKKWNELTNKEIDDLVNFISKLKLEVTSTKSFDNSQTVTGGVPLTEINLDTLETNKVKGLYLTGELIDIDGDCGGYNLTLSWLTGLVVGGQND